MTQLLLDFGAPMTLTACLMRSRCLLRRAAIKAFIVIGTLTVLLVAWVPTCALAQVPDLNSLLGQSGGTASGRIVQLVGLLTVLSIAPGLLIMVTSFTRFAIAFSFLRSGLGLQTTPANLILISLSLFMTFYVMAPTFDRAWDAGLRPLLDNKISEGEAYTKITQPFREFMLAQVRDKDLKLLSDLAKEDLKVDDKSSIDLRVLIPAFMISEVRRGFEIGFLIALPFLVIDMIVATLTMSMGMMMLSPTVISLPMKILFFILIDGWNMLVGSLVRSYN
jgi:flagellar biosynthetic protein FliP